jgi:ketosteroid isomerase-like protein
MSPKNVEIARVYFQAFDRGDLDAAAQFLAPQVDWDWDSEMLIDEQAIQGRDAVKEYWERVLATSPFAHEDHRFLDAGDSVCVLANIRLKGASSGVELVQPCGYALTLLDGMIVGSWFSGNQARAAKAAGLEDVGSS